MTARFEKAVALREQGDDDGAIAAWKSFAEEFPTDGRAALALVEAGVLLAGRKDFDGAIALWRGVFGRYAGDGEAPRAWLLLAKTLEDDLGRLDDAVKEYEALVAKHGGTSFGQEAAQRLARLRGKHLEVRGERVIGSGEPAVLRVASRNMPTLQVKVYKLGLEEYFRRKHSVAGVENVQVEIVKPDLTAEWKLEPYVPFALATADRAVPTAGPGAYVVVVSDDDLTSTTLLVVSDVETIVKASAGRQVFVWARNRATGRPEAGARVLLSTGSEIFGEGVTGQDGVYVLEGWKTARRVLVLAGPHAASSEWEPGQTFAEGWQTKVHVSTDRPVYRPGQRVRWRGIFRRADGGGYTVPSGVKGRAVLLDARGGEAAQAEVTCSEVGIFHGEFPLDGEAPLGDWNVRVDVDNRSFTGPFRVLEFRKPEFALEVVPGKPSYPTGEEVKATIRLRYGFGGPVVDAPVRWQVTRVPHDFAPSAVNDYSWYFQDAEALQRARDAARTAPEGALVAQGQATTDEKGEAVISFATTERDEDAEYVVSASAIDVTRRFVSDEGRIPVVRRDHAAVVTTDKRVYRPKQELRATLQTVDANQGPVARSGSLVLARVKRTAAPPPTKRPTPGGPIAVDRKGGGDRAQEEEIEVQALPVSTDAKGRAEVRIVAARSRPLSRALEREGRAGRHRHGLRGVRRRGRGRGPREGRAARRREGDLHRGRARRGAAPEPGVEGDGAADVRGREGARAPDRRDRRARARCSTWPIEALYAPNVTLKIAIPSKDRLLEAEDEIVVLRYLNVAVAPSKASAAPGDDVTFDVTTTDAAGLPVAADVGVAVVDEALLGVARDRTPAIRPFFYDRRAHQPRRDVVVGRIPHVRDDARDQQGAARERRRPERGRAADLRAERAAPRARGAEPRRRPDRGRAGVQRQPGRSRFVGRPRARGRVEGPAGRAGGAEAPRSHARRREGGR